MSFASQAAASGEIERRPSIWLAVTDPAGAARSGGWIGEAGGWIGRAAGAEIRIDNMARAVSSQHARVERDADSFVIIDQSMNGTDLNGERLVKGQRRRIAVGDVIGLCGWRIAVLENEPGLAVTPSRAMAPAASPQPLPSFAAAAETQPAPARPRLDLTLAELVGRSAPPMPAPPPPVDAPALAHLDTLLPPSVAPSPPPPSPQPVAPTPAEGASPDASPSDLLAAFWRGLGVAPSRATPALMEELGHAMHEAWVEAGRASPPPGGSEDTIPTAPRAGLRGLRAVLDSTETPRFAEALRAALAEPARREAILRDAAEQAASRMAESLSAQAVESRLSASVRTTWLRRRGAELWRQFQALEPELREAAETRFRKDLNERLRSETRLLTWTRPPQS